MSDDLEVGNENDENELIDQLYESVDSFISRLNDDGRYMTMAQILGVICLLTNVYESRQRAYQGLK